MYKSELAPYYELLLNAAAKQIFTTASNPSPNPPAQLVMSNNIPSFSQSIGLPEGQQAYNPATGQVNIPVAITSIIRGTAKADFLTGTDSSDKISGAAGNDTLTGATGNDTLNGGAGKDLLVGGKGADIFVFIIDNNNSRDTISDFSHQDGDKIDLSIIDANEKLAGDQAFAFIGNAAFSKTNAAGQLRFDVTSKILYGSTDADIAPEFSIQFNGVSSLIASDFVL